MADKFFLWLRGWSVHSGLAAFDWRQLLQLSDLGRWPWRVQALLLLLSGLISAALMSAALFLLSPKVSVEEHALLASLQDQIKRQQAHQLAAAVNRLELRKHAIFNGLLLKQYSARVMDITQTLEVVAAAASASGVQLLSLVPALEPALITASVPAVSRDDSPVVNNLRARLGLSSLSAFWSQLSTVLAAAEMTEIVLLHTEKPDLFDLSLGVRVPAVSFRDGASRISAPAANNNLPPASAPPAKGFLMRADGAQFVYLVRDNKGHLRPVDQSKNAEQHDGVRY